MRKPYTKKQVEAAAEAIGRRVGGEGGRWTEKYLPKVVWPDDYSEAERIRLRWAAADALFAAAQAK